MEPKIIAEKYQIAEHMKRVNEADYYLAVDLSTGETVTLRTIDISQTGAVGLGLEHLAADKLKRKMENEAKLLDQLKQPGLLSLVAHGFDNPIYYHVYPAFKFHNLQQEIELQGKIDYRDLLVYIRQVAQTLHALHHQGIIHCDVSAENILLLDGSAKVIEFTIANHEVLEGVSPGNPPYMCPEAIMGARPTPKRDIWALGVTLYFALTGLLPFGDIPLPRQNGVPILFQRILKDTPAPLINLPSELMNLVHQMLEKDPDHRIDDMNQVVSTIDKII